LKAKPERIKYYKKKDSSYFHHFYRHFLTYICSIAVPD